MVLPTTSLPPGGVVTETGIAAGRRIHRAAGALSSATADTGVAGRRFAASDASQTQSDQRSDPRPPNPGAHHRIPCLATNLMLGRALSTDRPFAPEPQMRGNRSGLQPRTRSWVHRAWSSIPENEKISPGSPSARCT
jgi:hypothetical protein